MSAPLRRPRMSLRFLLLTNYSSRSQTLQTRTEHFVVYHCCVPLRVSVCPSLSHSWNLTHSKTCFDKTKYEPSRVERTNITVYKYKHVKLYVIILKFCVYFRIGLQITYSEDCKLFTNIEFLHVDLLKQVKSTCSNILVFLSYLLILILRWVSKKLDMGHGLD